MLKIQCKTNILKTLMTASLVLIRTVLSMGFWISKYWILRMKYWFRKKIKKISTRKDGGVYIIGEIRTEEKRWKMEMSFLA